MVGSSSPLNGVRSKTEQAYRIVDCIGLYCPAPVLNTRQEMDKLAIGQILEVWE
jgi:TusA-related sulfurtransferase